MKASSQQHPVKAGSVVGCGDAYEKRANPLAPREAQLLLWRIEGYSDGVIARELGLTPGRVAEIIGHATSKLSYQAAPRL